ncbi:hypothetical protein EVAR_75935_1 [Eumeta japonica]|uniref:Uncharacterized protein n=1 Tax=Eumeta variegata TaxID=151549 RepID=A0A4C1UW53_EUMVA|nr:hypothetical protein EVAR_75935_1 [Eumeta japonica]
MGAQVQQRKNRVLHVFQEKRIPSGGKIETTDVAIPETNQVPWHNSSKTNEDEPTHRIGNKGAETDQKSSRPDNQILRKNRLSNHTHHNTSLHADGLRSDPITIEIQRNKPEPFCIVQYLKASIQKCHTTTEKNIHRSTMKNGGYRSLALTR